MHEIQTQFQWIGNYTRPTLHCHFEWPWVTYENIQFIYLVATLSAYCDSNPKQTVALTGCKLTVIPSETLGYIFSLSSLPSVAQFFHFAKNTAHIFIKLSGGNHFHEEIKWLRVGGKWNRNKRKKIREKIRIDMSSRCWRLANKFTRIYWTD